MKLSRAMQFSKRVFSFNNQYDDDVTFNEMTRGSINGNPCTQFRTPKGVYTILLVNNSNVAGYIDYNIVTMLRGKELLHANAHVIKDIEKEVNNIRKYYLEKDFRFRRYIWGEIQI